MAIQPGVWGIDLGQCALKALRLEVQDGQVTATAFDYVEHPKILSQPDADPDQLTREALEKFLSRNSLRGDLVAISVPGQSGLARFVKLPPVEEKKISEIVKFEAKQQIPFNLDEVVWDYQKIGQGMVTDGFAMETEIGLFAMKRDMVARYLQHFKEVNVEVHVVQMAPLSLCNYVAYDLLGIGADSEGEAPAPGKKRAIVALDIGADSSNLVVTDGNRIIWQRPIPLGGNHFTRALTKDLKLTFAKAEHLKRNATKSGAPELKQILTALKPVLNDFVGEVQRSLGYFTNTHRDSQVEYMMGLGSAFRLPGLQRFLADKLQLDVRKLGKLEKLAGDSVIAAPAFTENVLSFAVAYGLALQGLKVARLQTNLLPPEIRTERMIRAKKPWAAAAAAALLAGTALGPYLGYAFGFRSVNTNVAPLKGAVEKAKTVADRKTSLENAYNAKKTEAENEEKAVRAIIAGLDERFNWIQLNKFVSDALPRPDGRNLSVKAFDEFFKGDGGYTAGATAFERYKKRLNTVKTGSKDDPADVDPYLVQFSIESLDARFADDLSAVWSKLTGGSNPMVKPEEIRPTFRAKEAPKEKQSGWVVELRGSTYNHGNRRFVVEGLVQALANAGVKTKPPAGAATPPAAAAAPTTTPPASPTPADAAAPVEGAEDSPEDVKKPIVDRITHVLLVKTSSPDQPGGQDLTRAGMVAALVGGGGGGGMMSGGMGGGGDAGGMGAGGMGGSPPPGGGSAAAPPAGGGAATSAIRSGWASLLGGAGSGGGGMAGGMSPGGMGGPSMGMGGPSMGMGGAPASLPPPGVGGKGMMGGGDGGPGGMMTPPGGAAAGKPAQPGNRTDFIVVFFWREPTPSDQYLPSPIEDAPAGGGGDAGVGAPPSTPSSPAGGGGGKMGGMKPDS